MKRVLYGTSSLILWIILSIATALAQQATGPRMALEDKYFDAKQVKEGKIVEHTFTVRNRGDRPLEIKKVNPG